MRIDMFGSTVADPPKPLSADRRRTLRRQALFDRGIHPATRRAVITGATCGECIDCWAMGGGTTVYFKCGRMPITNGPGTDIRKSWPACELFLAAGEERER